MARTLEDVSTELSTLAERVSRLEQLLGASKGTPDSSTPPNGQTSEGPQPRPVAAEQSHNTVLDRRGIPPVLPEVAHGSRRTFLPATNLLGAVAVICFVLAGAFFVKLAIDSGWLTPARQLGIASIFGGSLVLAGLWLRDDEPGYSAFLPGAGVVVLFLAAFSGHLFWHLLSGFEAAVFATLISLSCLWLYRIFQSDYFPIVAAIGTYLIPFLTNVLPARDATFVATSRYFLCWAVLYAILGVLVKTRALILTAGYLGLVILAVLAFDRPSTDLWPATAQLVQFVIFAGGALAFSLYHGEPLRKRDAWLLTPIVVFFYVTECSLLETARPGVAPFWMIAVAVFMVALVVFSESVFKKALESRAPVENFVALTVTHAIFFELLPETIRPWFVLGAVCVFRAAYRWGLKLQGFLAMLALPVLAIYQCGYIVDRLLGSVPDTQPEPYWAMVALIFAALLVYAGSDEDGADTRAGASLRMLGCWLGHGLAVAALFNMSAIHGGIAVSLAWGCYALLILGIGMTLRKAALAKSSLIVLLAAVIKVFTYDISESSSGVRIVSLLITGVVLYTSGFFFRRIHSWNKA